MKFKLIFIIFNIAILISFGLIFFMPLMFLGWEYTKDFWSSNWYLPLLFIAIIGVLNSYFIANWKLFDLLEREDWNGLVTFLEKRVLEKNRLTQQNIRLLVHGYVVRSDMNAVKALGERIREKSPAMFNRNALLFGIPHLLSNHPAQMEEYFRTAIEGGASDINWLQWNRAFSLMMLDRKNEAKEILLSVVRSRERDTILLLLNAYLMDSFSRQDTAVAEEIQKIRTVLTKRFTRSAWEKEIERAKGNLQVVILIRLVQEATDWLYK